MTLRPVRFLPEALEDLLETQHSKVQTADQLFDRAAQLTGHVLEDLPQGADPEGLVGWNGEVLLLAVST